MLAHVSKPRQYGLYASLEASTLGEGTLGRGPYPGQHPGP